MAQLHYGLLTLCLCLSSCQMFFTPELLVIASGPSVGRYSSVFGLEAWVEFSDTVPHGTAEKGILLKENGSTMEVRYAWTGRRVDLTPVCGFTLGNRYDLTVASTVENIDGADLGTEFVLTFYTRPDDVRPTVQVVSPTYGTVAADRYQPVVLRFSRAVDRASFFANVSISPSFKAAYTWAAADTLCTVTPLEKLRSPAVYTVKVGSSLADVFGNTLGADLTSWFSEGAVAAGPSVSSVVRTASGTPDTAYVLTPVTASGTVAADTGFERTWGLEIRFDRPVERSGLDSFITVEPSWGFTVPYTQALMQNIDLVPASPLAYGTTYTLTVRKGVADVSGNVSTADHIYRFKVDGPGSGPPRLLSLAFHTNIGSPATDVILGDHTTDYTALDAGAFGNVPTATFLVLTFQLAQGASVDTASLMEHFSVTATDANTFMAKTAVGAPVVLSPTQQSVRVDVTLTRVGSGLLVFRLSAGLADSLGNVTSADEAWPVLE